MKTTSAVVLCAILFICGSCSGQRRTGGAANKGLPTFRFQNAVIVLSDSADGAAVLSAGDAYTRSFTAFDLQGRLGRTDSGGTEQDYLQLAARQCRNWSSAQQDSLRASFAKLDAWLRQNAIRLHLPDTVRVVHSKCEEELGSEGYTRRNLIMLNGGTDLHLVSHELFHVLSRFNPELRDRLYEVIGFQKCQPIHYQAAFKGRTITNPDCPVVEHYAQMRTPADAVDADGPSTPLTLVLYSAQPYRGGNVFVHYLKIGVLSLKRDGDSAMSPLLVNGKPSVTELDNQTMPRVVNKLEVNTPYLLHPEEISAEHFSLLIEGARVKYPERLTAMRKVLQNGR